MDIERVILSVLESKKFVSDFAKCKDEKTYGAKKYDYIYRFILTVENTNFNMILAVPRNWQRELFDIYFEEVEGVPLIPHLEKMGKICLFETEGALIEPNFELILNDILDRMYKIVDEGLTGINKEDFIIEFSAYWGKLPNILILNVDIALEEENKEIMLMELGKDKKNYFAADKNRAFEFKRLFKFENETVKNGVYIYIDSDEYIYPPDWRLPLKIEYINEILNNKSVGKKDILKLLRKKKHSIILIFNVRQPNETVSLFGVKLENYDVNEKGEIIASRHIHPIYIDRWDDNYLVNRGGGLSNFNNKNIFIIGCGSIGGYLINELVKAGFKNLTFTDYDNLSKENVYRHVLGFQSFNKNKAIAMKEHITQNILYTRNSINCFEKSIEDLLAEDNNLFKRYDLIISAVGNHNLNRWLNRYLSYNNIDTPIIYGWNEALGIGSHVAFIDRKYPGCYECFFKIEEETGIVYDRTSFSQKGQVFTKKMMGCSSSYIPFGSCTSITTAIGIIDTTKKYFENRLNDNVLISSKGDSYYMENEGFLLSRKYITQENKEKEYLGSKFKNTKCEVCKDEN